MTKNLCKGRRESNLQVSRSLLKSDPTTGDVNECRCRQVEESFLLVALGVGEVVVVEDGDSGRQVTEEEAR